MVAIRQCRCIRAKVVVLEKKVVFEQTWLYSGKVVVLGTKWLYSGKIGCIRAKWLCSGKSGSIRAKMVVFEQSGCIWSNSYLARIQQLLPE